MRILSTPNLHQQLVQLLHGARHIRLASAYLGADATLWGVVTGCKQLEILVSAEWHMNDPRALEDHVRRGAVVRVIESDDPRGRLHAKALVATDRHGARVAAIGSANFTRPGLHSNHELGCLLRDPDDAAAIDEVSRLVAHMWSHGAAVTDWRLARATWSARRHPRASGLVSSGTSPGAWLLKTTIGETGISYWPQFEAESVIAIGWEGIAGDPASMSPHQLRQSVAAAGFKPRAATRIEVFFKGMQVGDAVAIIRGFKSGQQADGFIHAFATVLSDARSEPHGGPWWRFKRDAHIVPLGLPVPARLLPAALHLGSCRETIHKTTSAALERVLHDLRSSLGVTVGWQP